MKQFRFIFKTDQNIAKDITLNANGMFEAMKKAQLMKKELEKNNPRAMITVEFIGIAYTNIA
ncbi:hypothetical protein [Litchfieldia salsa]|uniref:Uncharacterized protein n=1 Tax=Litchfieldia salsa TaxID=930152 RepID=A0A1H0QBN2_9BACI|nr:hypothetical protein [Litchfieldia salsa]SDP14772.1 hypothetical protein SAMN05216565_101690 [Litchfieldia salsa]